ncbi:uncharacterized protein LOC129571088 [Sitodiplosis mosellana]|uniref:uncharacterized protein LOC129571088 n=1 Tax=Sitodiplosis mosellana TaxID=263140 RepID=UPI002444ED31|nr:uncharacterized protein LOC129571088 [Sitodiplosis mosellana]
MLSRRSFTLLLIGLVASMFVIVDVSGEAPPGKKDYEIVPASKREPPKKYAKPVLVKQNSSSEKESADVPAPVSSNDPSTQGYDNGLESRVGLGVALDPDLSTPTLLHANVANKNHRENKAKEPPKSIVKSKVKEINDRIKNNGPVPSGKAKARKA